MAVPQRGKEACRLRMMVVMVAVLHLGVEAQVARRHLIMVVVAEAVVIPEMLPLNQLQRLSSVMLTVVIPVTIQGFTSQTFLLM